MNKKGFTLLEILIVITLMGILATLIMTSFLNSLLKGRDNKRKQDLQQISNSLELYYSDYNLYPSAAPTPNTLPWGGSLKRAAEDSKFYMRELPNDPSSSSFNYVYVSDGTYFKLYSCLENSEDLHYDNITPTPPTPNCGAGCANICHYGIASPNEKP